LTSAAAHPTVGRTRPRRHAWSALLSFLLLAGLLILPAASASATSFVVVNTSDAGQGSLRQAILDANANPGADDITFAIGGFRPLIISLFSPLPEITEQVSLDASTESGSSCAGSTPTLRVSIEGSNAPPGTSGFTVSDGVGTMIRGFIIRQFGGDGISLLSPASGTTLECNSIGTTPDLSIQEGMGGAGIAVRSTGPGGSVPTSIVGNIVMNNGGPGILVDPSARLVSIRNNRIDNNVGVGIDLIANGGAANGDGSSPNGAGGPGAGGNDLQPMPVLSAASSASGVTTVSGSLSVPSAVAGQFVIEFFTQNECDKEPSPGGFGEGARPIGSVSLSASSSPGPSTIPFTANGLGNANTGAVVTATATDGFGSGNTSEFSACMPVVAGTGASSADLSAAGSVSPLDVAAGGTLTYTLTAQNAGPDPASDVTLVSVLPNGINLSSATSGAGSCPATGFTVTCALGTMGPGTDTQVTIVANAQDVAGVVDLNNRVSVSTTTSDPNMSNNAVTVTSSAHPRSPNLSVMKDGPAQVVSGDGFSYTIRVANAGPDVARSVAVTDTLPIGVSFVVATPSVGSCGAASGTVSCALGTLATLATASVVIKVSADALAGTDAIVVSNTASVSSDRPDQDPNDNVSAPVLTKVVPVGGTDLALTSVANVPNPVTGGYDLGSTATVTNAGPGDATQVSLTDTLAAGESFVATGSDPSCSAAGNIVTCAIGAVAKGGIATVLVITKTPEVTEDTTLHDGFAVTAPEDTTPANNVLDVATTVLARRADFVAGYVPPLPSTSWITDVTTWSHGVPIATPSDPTVAWVAVPGGGPGGPVTITERPCGLPFVCVVPRPMGATPYPYPRGVFGNLVSITVPSGYGASNAIAGVFLDDSSVVGGGWGPFNVSYLPAGASAPSQLSWCGGWRHAGPPCVTWLDRIFSWWNPYANGDLHSVVRFTQSGTFGRGR
jgi:uncharacterized repeat protein (TIGR01451 family)